jgi:hypothetical protein
VRAPVVPTVHNRFRLVNTDSFGILGILAIFYLLLFTYADFERVLNLSQTQAGTEYLPNNCAKRY